MALHKVANFATGRGPLLSGLRSVFDPKDDSDPNNDDNEPVSPPSIAQTNEACTVFGVTLVVVLALAAAFVVVALLQVTCAKCKRYSYNRKAILIAESKAQQYKTTSKKVK